MFLNHPWILTKLVYSFSSIIPFISKLSAISLYLSSLSPNVLRNLSCKRLFNLSIIFKIIDKIYNSLYILSCYQDMGVIIIIFNYILYYEHIFVIIVLEYLISWVIAKFPCGKEAGIMFKKDLLIFSLIILIFLLVLLLFIVLI